MQSKKPKRTQIDNVESRCLLNVGHSLRVAYGRPYFTRYVVNPPAATGLIIEKYYFSHPEWHSCSKDLCTNEL
jgi:hypothetical protein